MTFQSDCTEKFIHAFQLRKQAIASFEGCNGVSLLRDTQNPDVFFTYSRWDTAQDLEHYRKSVFFENTWSEVKVWFSARPEAWSLEDVE